MGQPSHTAGPRPRRRTLIVVDGCGLSVAAGPEHMVGFLRSLDNLLQLIKDVAGNSMKHHVPQRNFMCRSWSIEPPEKRVVENRRHLQLVESNRTLWLSKSAISAALHPVAMRARVCRYAGNGTKSLCNPTT